MARGAQGNDPLARDKNEKGRAAAQGGAQAIAKSYKRGLPTPSPLRRMEDPCADHIMPSRSEKKSKTQNSLMLPPAVPPSRRRRKSPQVLDEDSFVDAMGEIIERDFFPELPKLQRQMKWLQALESRQLRSLAEVQRLVLSGGSLEQIVSRADTGAGLGDSGHGLRSETPLSTAASSDAPTLPPLPLTLDQFLARFHSEDDAAFDDLAERMREAHRRKYWWVYAHPQLETGKEELYLLPNGEMMTEEEQRRHVEAANAKPRLGDDRPNAPETWPIRAKNALMFGPGSLEENARVHERGRDGATQPALLLEDEEANGTRPLLLAGNGGNARVGLTAKAPKRLVHSNTRFHAGSLSWKGRDPSRASPLERPRSDASSSSAATSASAAQREVTEGFVPMTPLLVPGAEGDVPIMTWGEVESTPLRVAEPFDYGSPVVPVESRGDALGSRQGFHIQPTGSRERVANALESQVRNRAKAGKKEGGKATGGVTKRSGKRGFHSLTPAAQSLAAKLAGAGKGEALGGGASVQLRASYSAKGGTGLAGGGGRTPRLGQLGSHSGVTPSPLRPMSKRGQTGGTGSRGTASGSWSTPSLEEGSSRTGSKVTENLLNI